MHKDYFFHILANSFSYLFGNSHSNRSEVISHRSFDLLLPLLFSDVKTFHVPAGHLYALFGKMSIQVLCPVFDYLGFCCCCCCFAIIVLFIFCIISPYLRCFASTIFSHLLGGLFFLSLFIFETQRE